MTRLGFLTASLLAFCVPALAEQSAQEMLKQITDMRPPSLDASKRNDQAYIQSYLAERDKYIQERGDRIKAFFDKYPDDPKAWPLMQERWMAMIGMGKQTDMAVTEIEQLLSKQTDNTKRADLLFYKGMAQLRSRPPGSKAADTVEEFIKTAPKDDRGAQLLYQLAQMDESKQAEIMKRIVADYPASQAGQMAKGALKRVEAVGKPFELAFTDAISGKQISMADLKGKVVVIDFWATWCGPCVAEMPKMKQLYAEYKPKGVEFIGVSLDQSESAGGLTKLKEFVQKEGIEWPQYYQGNYWQSEFSAGWGINSIPSVFIIDANGNLYSTEARGKLEKLIPELIAKRDGKST
jgi:thiol-disulfide isomerase/thioredoxin